MTLSEDHCTLTVQGKVNGWTDSPLTYVMDGSTETTIDLGKTTAEWQGGSILMKITFKSSSQPGSMLRYLRGEEMCVEFRCGDIAATRVFRRLAKE